MTNRSDLENQISELREKMNSLVKQKEEMDKIEIKKNQCIETLNNHIFELNQYALTVQDEGFNFKLLDMVFEFTYKVQDCIQAGTQADTQADTQTDDKKDKQSDSDHETIKHDSDRETSDHDDSESENEHHPSGGALEQKIKTLISKIPGLKEAYMAQCKNKDEEKNVLTKYYSEKCIKNETIEKFLMRKFPQYYYEITAAQRKEYVRSLRRLTIPREKLKKQFKEHMEKNARTSRQKNSQIVFFLAHRLNNETPFEFLNRLFPEPFKTKHDLEQPRRSSGSHKKHKLDYSSEQSSVANAPDSSSFSTPIVKRKPHQNGLMTTAHPESDVGSDDESSNESNNEIMTPFCNQGSPPADLSISQHLINHDQVHQEQVSQAADFFEYNHFNQGSLGTHTMSTTPPPPPFFNNLEEDSQLIFQNH